MTALEALRAELVLDATTSGLVGGRIYPQVLPQGVTFPAVAMTMVSETRDTTMTGIADQLFAATRVQVDVFAKKYIDAHAAALAVDNVIANLARPSLSAYRDNAQDMYDDVTQLHRVSMDYIVSM